MSLAPTCLQGHTGRDILFKRSSEHVAIKVVQDCTSQSKKLNTPHAQQLGNCARRLQLTVADTERSLVCLAIVREINVMSGFLACLQLDAGDVRMRLHLPDQRRRLVIDASLICKSNQVHFCSSCLNQVQGLVQPCRLWQTLFVSLALCLQMANRNGLQLGFKFFNALPDFRTAALVSFDFASFCFQPNWNSCTSSSGSFITFWIFSRSSELRVPCQKMQRQFSEENNMPVTECLREQQL